MIDPAQIPPEVVEAAAKQIHRHSSKPMSVQEAERLARAAIAAALSAWPNAWISASVGNGSLILPLPQEARDEN